MPWITYNNESYNLDYITKIYLDVKSDIREDLPDDMQLNDDGEGFSIFEICIDTFENKRIVLMSYHDRPHIVHGKYVAAKHTINWAEITPGIMEFIEQKILEGTALIDLNNAI